MTLLAAQIGVVASTRSGVSFSDNFNRADSNPMSGPWSTNGGFANACAIVSNQVEGSALSGFANNSSYVNAPTFPADQSAALAFTQSVANTSGGGPTCREAPGVATMYGVQIFGSGLNPLTADLFKFIAGTYTAIDTASITYTPGDVFKVEAIGDQIKGYQNGVEILSATDSAIASGQPGIYLFGNTPLKTTVDAFAARSE